MVYMNYYQYSQKGNHLLTSPTTVASLNSTESPLSIFSAYANIHRQLQSLLCQGNHSKTGCRCKELESCYGPRLFKCDRLGCSFHNLGFETRRERKAHIEAHDRSFKCPKLDCQFSDLGFTSEAALGRHMDQCHHEEIFVPKSPTPVFLDMEPRNLDTLFLDSVSAGDIGNVRRLVGLVSYMVSNEGYIEALRYSTTAMVKLFLDFGKDINKIPPIIFSADSGKIPLVQAIQRQNYEVAKYLLGRGCDVNKKQEAHSRVEINALDAALSLSSDEDKLKAVFLLIDYGVDLSQRSIQMSSLLSKRNNHNQEVIKLLEIFKAVQQIDEFTEALLAVAQGNCSIEVAEYLLRNGANVDGLGTPPLRIAAKRKTRSAANFIKFLLESGANPFTISTRGNSSGVPYGARNFSKWLGMTWDELIESTKSARAK